MASKRRKTGARSPSLRRDELRTLLRQGWMPLPDILERLGVSRATAFRMLADLGESGDAVEKAEIEGRVCWRLPPLGRHEPIRVSTSEMVAMTFVRDALRFLTGTGIKEDLDNVLARVTHALKKSDYALSKNLDRKLHDVNEHTYDYADAFDGMNDILTALLREERLRVDFRDGHGHYLDPYTLQLYKKGLYLIGWSHKHAAVRSFSIDKFANVEWCRGEKFEYPADYRPEDVRGDSFGIIRGPRQRVVIRFSNKVAYFVRRRRWHRTQAITEVETGGIELVMECEGITEVASWVLGFGGHAEVLEPPELRQQVTQDIRLAAQRYGLFDGPST